ncbi:hybrid sensor histidine kinase/response regulator [Woodsholea maritima]|uniref:hybrid sensor histidine kinase/response regulator n=1 Tax=Woodsholea maritima TaxID=240237 RepID=UPI000366AA6F|nr:ATP-binding protein [Woodsholea maritima]
MAGQLRPHPDFDPSSEEDAALSASKQTPDHGSGSAIARLVLDQMGELVLARDEDNRLTEVNQAFTQTFGGTREDWIGRWFAVAPAIKEEGGPRRYEAGMRTQKGDLWVEWVEYPLVEGGSLAVGRDVTERRRAEAQEREAAKGKNIFFAAITHELRTPLSGTLGAARLLEDTHLRPDQRAYVEALKSSASHALALVDDILDLSRIEAGKLTLRAEPVDLRALIEEVSELMASKAAEKNLVLAHVCEHNLPTTIEADPARLRQILFNLVGNAVKFTKTGGVLITSELDPDHQVRISVRDTGPGINAVDRTHLFQHFERGAAERTAQPGAGLGLAMVKRLAEAMGGEVGVESEPGHGAHFWVRFPPVILDKSPGPQSLYGQTIALAVGCHIQREALSRQCLALGADVIEATQFSDLPLEPVSSLILDEDQIVHLHQPKAKRVMVLATPQTKVHYMGHRRPKGVDGWLVAPVRLSSLGAHISANTDELNPKKATVKKDEKPLKGLRLLLAEDDAVNGLIIETVLRRLGAEAERVSNGRSALNRLAPGLYDAALLDMRMPELDGPDTARAIRDLGDGRAAMPLIALTANATEADRLLCLEAGMNAFLTKPVEEDDLILTLKRLCQR